MSPAPPLLPLGERGACVHKRVGKERESVTCCIGKVINKKEQTFAMHMVLLFFFKKKGSFY